MYSQRPTLPQNSDVAQEPRLFSWDELAWYPSLYHSITLSALRRHSRYAMYMSKTGGVPAGLVSTDFEPVTRIRLLNASEDYNISTHLLQSLV